MENQCVSGKKSYPSLEVAEDALIALWGINDYAPGQGPIAVYRCEDCGAFHFTSREPMNERLAKAIADGRIHLQREASRWAGKWKRK